MQTEGSVCRSESTDIQRDFPRGNSHMWVIKVSEFNVLRAYLLTAFAQTVCL